VKRLLLIGGGHSHIEVVRRFGARAFPDSEITLVDAERFATYSGMVPGLIAGHYQFNDCHIDLAALAGNAGVGFVHARVTGIDATHRRATLSNGIGIDYDLVSIDVGATPPTANVPGAADNAFAVKPFAAFAQNWDTLIERANRGGLCSIVAVGGGAASIELILAMQYRLAPNAASTSVRFSLVSDAPCLVPDHNDRTRAAITHLLTERGISLYLKSRVERIEPDALVLSDANRIQSDATIWATGAGAPRWLRDTGIKLDAAGFVAINECLSSASHASVFAAGDCATMQGYSYPKSGVYAVRQGPVLAENLRRALIGQRLMKFRPQRRTLSLISTGNKYAVATYGRYSHEGAWVWRWKNYIDRKFMRQYQSGR
jgi:pyridine nucleotide-disulfide oxidoreductase family protein